MKYVVFDVETPNHNNDRMSSIGIVVIEEGKIVDHFSSLINPETYFDDFNVELTNISENDVKDKPTFKQLWPTLKRYFDEGIVVAHNARFDLNVLKSCLKQYHIEYHNLIYICTLTIAYRYFHHLENRRLNTICKYLNVDLNHHEALSDAKGCAYILLHYLNNNVFIKRYMKLYKLNNNDISDSKVVIPVDYELYFSDKIKKNASLINKEDIKIVNYDHEIKAFVKKYHVNIKVINDCLFMECDCSYKENCKHEYALLEYVKNEEIYEK